MSRLLALTLALIIGSPNCWCCLLKTASVPVPHDCCMMGSNEANSCPLDKSSTKKGGSDEDCSCDQSKTKREMSTVTVALPALTFTIAAPPDTDVLLSFANPFSAIRWLTDDGPPHDRLFIFAQNCALRL